MTLTLSRIAGFLLGAAGVGLAAVAIAGDLNPPPGPVSPTMKTLKQVEPRTPVESLPGSPTATYLITQPGSYYLAGNITGEAGKDGIFIGSDNVILDLMGFTLSGVPGAGGGVNSQFGRKDIAVCNGTVSNWTDGVSIAAENALIRNIFAISNLGDGIYGHSNAMIIDCVSANNGDVGIGAAIEGMIVRCTARQNGRDGLAIGQGEVRECMSVLNVRHGITVGNVGRSTVTGNTCYDNGTGGNGAGIFVYSSSSGNRIEANNVTHNTRGIDADGAGNLIIKNSASGNTGTGSPSANYDIVAGNAYGQILNVAGVGQFTNSEPWANFEF